MRALAIGVAAVVVIAVAAVGAAFGIDRYAKSLAERDLASMLAPSKGIATHGATHYSLLKDEFDAEAIAAESTEGPWKSIRIGRLALRGLDPLGIKSLLFGPHGATRPVADTVRLSDVSVDMLRGGHYEARELTLVEPGNIDPTVLAGLGSDDATALRAVGALSASRVELDGYRFEFPARARHGSASQVTAEGIGSGHIAKLEVRALNLDAGADPSPGVQAIHSEIGSIEATGIDIAANAALLDQGPEALTDQTFYAPVETIVFEDTHILAGNADLKLRHAALERPRLQRIVAALGRSASLPPDRIGRIFGAIAVGKEEYEGLEIQVTGKNGGHISLKRLGFSDVAPGRVGGAALESLGFESAEGKLNLESVALDGLAYRGYSDKARAGLAALGISGDKMLPGRIFLKHFELRNLGVVSGGRRAFGLKSIDLNSTGSISLATGIDFRMGDLTVDLSRVPTSSYGWGPADLGISELRLDVDGKVQYDPDAKVLEMPRYAFVLPGLGSIILSMSLGNLEIEKDADDPAEGIKRLMASTLRRFEIRYEDDSFANRLLAFSARRANQDLESFRTALIAQLEAQARAVLIETPRAQMLDAVIAFLKSPKAISIVLEPPHPLPLNSFAQLSAAKPDDIPRMLGLSIH